MNRLGTSLAFDLCEYQFTHYGFFGRAKEVKNVTPKSNTKIILKEMLIKSRAQMCVRIFREDTVLRKISRRDVCGNLNQCFLKYENGTEKIISLNGVVDSSGKKFEPVSEDELVSVIISFFAND